MKTIFTFLIIALITISISCKSDNDQTNKQQDTISTTSQVDTTTSQPTTLGKEYTSLFICPNHCKDSGGDEFGICPVCGMEYIENPDYQ
ncbi:MAG: hypothetical protein JXR68_00425 [Bacteroidales bacterium]|nr:hypothetical protein [Bacteroidales bacterium]